MQRQLPGLSLLQVWVYTAIEGCTLHSVLRFRSIQCLCAQQYDPFL